MDLIFYGNVRPFFNDPEEMYNRLMTVYTDRNNVDRSYNGIELIETGNPDSSTRVTLGYRFVSGEIYHLATMGPDEQTRIRRGHPKGKPLFDYAYIFRSPCTRINRSLYFGIALLRKDTPVCAFIICIDSAPIRWSIPAPEWKELYVSQSTDCIFTPTDRSLVAIGIPNLFKDYKSIPLGVEKAQEIKPIQPKSQKEKEPEKETHIEFESIEDLRRKLS